ncbi:hypothetical protein IF2G_02521 [Cordyceps javanica]|nr:hypothetical protein IF2G_02521 [Cordyceps javanica]
MFMLPGSNALAGGQARDELGHDVSFDAGTDTTSSFDYEATLAFVESEYNKVRRAGVDARKVMSSTKKCTTPGVRWSSPTQLLIWRSSGYRSEIRRDPDFSLGYGRTCQAIEHFCFIYHLQLATSGSGKRESGQKRHAKASWCYLKFSTIEEEMGSVLSMMNTRRHEWQRVGAVVMETNTHRSGWSEQRCAPYIHFREQLYLLIVAVETRAGAIDMLELMIGCVL